MRVILIAAAIAAGTSVPAAAASRAHSAAAGEAYLRGFVCHRSLDPGKRVVGVTAVMGTVPGTQHLQMRFVLQRRNGRSVASVNGGDLGRWISPTSSTLGRHPSDQWIVNHPVTGVPVPGTYRFSVSFRWIGAAGQTLGQTQRTSAACRQPDLRPNLYVRLVSAAAVSGGERYDVVVGNRGPTGARNVQLEFAPAGGAPPQSETIIRLKAHGKVARTFIGPACTASSGPATITVDPNALIAVSSRADNSITVPCPAG